MSTLIWDNWSTKIPKEWEMSNFLDHDPAEKPRDVQDILKAQEAEIERLRTWLGDSEMTVSKLRAALEGLNDWMREPDFAAACDLEWLTEWANRRPISAVRKALAKADVT